MSDDLRTPLYCNGLHYDAEYRDYTVDIPFYVERARAAGGPVLEVACGTGRLTIPIAGAGVDITGLDLAPEMLSRARDKAAEAGVIVDWIEADCRDFHLGRAFALVFCPFNSMQCLHDRESIESFLACVREHLAPGGRFIVEVFNPNVAILARGPDLRSSVCSYPNPCGDGDVYIEEVIDYDDAAQVSHNHWYYAIPGEEDIREEELRMRCFYPQELDMLLHYNGFEILEKLGDFDGKAFAAGDARQIVVCRAADARRPGEA